MGIITVSLDDDIEQVLRTLAKRLYGSKKGAISKVIEEAIKNLDYIMKQRSSRTIFKAYKDNELIAEAFSLDELASKLKRYKVDPRDIRIISNINLKSKAKMGYRFR